MRKAKILVIDDEKDLTSLIESILEIENFEVHCAYDGLSGLKMCSKIKPDLILLDYILPGLKGNEVIREIRKDPGTKDVPIIIMSGLGDVFFPFNVEERNPGGRGKSQETSSDEEKFMEKFVRPDDFEGTLTKPFRKDELIHKVKDALKGV